MKENLQTTTDNILLYSNLIIDNWDDIIELIMSELSSKDKLMKPIIDIDLFRFDVDMAPISEDNKWKLFAIFELDYISHIELKYISIEDLIDKFSI